MSVIVITGASSGIGRAAARELAAAGHELGIVGRDPDRTRAVADEVGGTAFLADFDRLADVRSLAVALRERYDTIDVLANNAGGLLRHRRLSADGVERTWQHNVLAPFILTHELLPTLERSGARVIFTGSIAHRWGTVDVTDLEWRRRRWLGGWPPYGAAKRADMMLARELPRRTGLDAYSFHPGFVRSNFGAESFGSGLLGTLARRSAITPEQGALPLIHLASTPDLGVETGTYFDGLRPEHGLAGQVRDRAETAELWDALTRQARAVGARAE